MEHFTHLPDYKVVVCQKCKYAVLPSQIDTHLAGEKHGLKKPEREIIIEEIAEIDGLIGNEETLKRSEFQFPPATSQPIIELEAPNGDGLECRLETGGRPCMYICCTENGMRQHCWTAHKWRSKNKGGRPPKYQTKRNKRANEIAWYTGIYCQRFFIQGPKSNYFKIENPQPRAHPNPQIRSRIDHFERAKQELERVLKAAEEQEIRKIKEFEESREPNPWLRRVAWAQHLENISRVDIEQWLETPDEDEPELQILCTAFDWMIQEAQFTATQEVVGQAALFEANRKELDKEPQMPFDSWMDITTIHKYTQVWRQILCYIIRTQEDDEEFRPPYELTEQQQSAIDKTTNAIAEFHKWKKDQPDREEGEDESDEEIAYMDRIQNEILDLCIELLDHPLQDTEYKSAIISGLAGLGVREDGGWLSAEDYTPKYSAVIKLARLMVIQKGYNQRESSIQKAMWDQKLSAQKARRQAKGYYHHVHQMTNRFMVMAHSGRDPTPMQWIFKSRSYGLKIRYTTTAEGCIQWIGDTVLYQKMRFDKSQFRSMIHGVVQEAREELFQNLMKVDIEDPSKIPSINWDHMFDNPAESRVGWSFLDDERSKFDVDGQWWLYERMYHEQHLREHFMDENPEQPFKPEAAYAYQQSIDRFRESLLFLMHISSQPPRAPEILGLRWKNTGQGGARNIFIEDGMVAYVAAYHKNYRNSGSIKIIHRYLPREVGELLVYYLWLVLPFHEKLQFHATGSYNASAFLWGDGEKKEHRQWTGPRRGRREGVKDRIGGQQNRSDVEPAPSQGRDSTPRQGRESTPSQGRDSPPRQGKPKPTGTREWNSERLRHILQAASERYIGVKIHISALRQIVIAMSRRFCRENPFLDGKSHPEDDQEGDEEDNEWDLQTGHGTHVGGMIYGRELMEDRDTVIGRREKFREISQIWHRFLEFSSAMPGSGIGQKRKRSHVEDDIQEAQRARLARLRHVDIHEQLKQMETPDAEFRGLQEPALKAIMENKSRILVIMGTGGGKSLMFQLPARSQKSGTTIVIVPLKSLEKNLHKRCIDAGISCIRWDPQKSNRSAQIILVQPESAVSVRFAQQLNRLQGMGQLDRVVMDECHTVMDSSPDFRPAMKEAGVLMLERGVQMVYLTATLPPADEAEFFDIIRVESDEVESIDIFRGVTTRPNIRYSVQEHSADIEEHDKVKESVGEKLEQYPTPAKVIVYSSSIDSIRQLGEALDCHTYFHDVGSHDAKDKIQEQWQNADGRVIVASNAFGLGIDSPDVRVVIHVGPIYQMRSYVQESGRAGRDGDKSEAIIIRGEGLQEALQQQHARSSNRPTIAQPIFNATDKARNERRKVDEFISGADCRRICLDREMDGRTDRTRCEGIEEKCDVCEKEYEDIRTVEAMRVVYQRQQERASTEQNQGFDSGINIPTSTPIRIRTTTSRDIRQTPSNIQSSPPMMPYVFGNSSQDSQSTNTLLNHVAPSPELPPIRSNTSGLVPSSPLSIISSDQGFTAEMIRIADSIEIKSKQDEREQSRFRIQSQNQQGSAKIRELEHQLERLKGVCPLCTIRKLEHRYHSIQYCNQLDARQFQQYWKDMRELMRKKEWFELFSCCMFCHVPQVICQRWEYNEENGRWKPSNMNCQFDEIIMPIVTMGLKDCSDWIVHSSIKWAKEGGFELGNEEHTYKWFGQRLKWGSHDVSRLVEAFYMFICYLEV